MRKRNHVSITAAALGAAALFGTAYAQVGRGGSEWLTARGDAQRTSWIPTDALISVAALSKPGFELQWKTTLENANRGGYGLGQGVTAPGVTLFVPTSIVTGSSNNIYAIDSDTGYLVWQRHFDPPMATVTDVCPGGTTSAATRIVSIAPPPITAAEPPGAGRAGQAYRSVLGEPGEGAPVDVRGGGPARGGTAPARAGAAPGRGSAESPAGQRPTAPAPGRGPAGSASQRGGSGRADSAPTVPGAPADQFAVSGLGRPPGVVYAVSSDGVLHVMGLMSGKDLQRPAPFVPAKARWSDPIAVRTTLYTSTSDGCGSAPNAVWAIDLESDSKPVVSWKSGGPIVGALAFTTDGTLVAAIGPTSGDADGKPNAIVTLDPRTLHVKDWFSPSGTDLVTGPAIFKHGDREIIAAATRNGRVLLLDAASLGGASHTAAMADATFRPGTANMAIDALATWQEITMTPPPSSGVSRGTRWILVPTELSVEALRIDERRRAPTLVHGWTASTPTRPATPVIVNGVVFVVETGQAAAGGIGGSAVLHAYEGATGKELWSSGKTMTAAAAPGSFWSAFGQVYVGTIDGTLYAFGFADERR
ncbi:MAG TPA: PQQ-binding-like beta-propeller repeat protein [Vicinamibacterales bacterium]|jgi:outer membrane protein assembly factor BamB|nr:PQQ-binding-like beta-propeller repeat protein [Vicinamibacterales bacterium]